MSLYEIWNEAYNLFAETQNREAVRDYLKCHVAEGNILQGDAKQILADVVETYYL